MDIRVDNDGFTNADLAFIVLACTVSIRVSHFESMLTSDIVRRVSLSRLPSADVLEQAAHAYIAAVQ